MNDETLRLVLAGDDLTDGQAAELERKLEEDSDDLASRFLLLGFYYLKRKSPEMAKARFKHAAWLVEHHPKHSIHQSAFADMNPSFDGLQLYEQMKALWLKQLEQNGDDIDILGNAAEFFTLPEAEFAEGLLLRAKLLAPDDWYIEHSLKHTQYLLDHRKLNKALREGHFMTSEQALALEQKVELDSSDFDARVRLLSYYRPRRGGPPSIIKERLKHVVWLIENTPGHSIHHSPCPITSVRPEVDGSEPYQQIKAVWLRQVELSPDETAILLNAAFFFLLDDFELTEQLVLRAKDLAPDDYQAGVDLEFVNYLKANPEQKRVIGP